MTQEASLTRTRLEVIRQIPLLASCGENALRAHADKPDAGLVLPSETLAYKTIEEIAELMREEDNTRRREEVGDVMAYLAALSHKLELRFG